MSDNLTPHKAADYDLKVRNTIPFYETIHSEVLRLVRIIKPDVKCWVDTGCGTGQLVNQALTAFPKAEFILADPAPSMLEQARQNLAHAEACRVRFLPPGGSAELAALVSAGVADVVTAIQCHHYLDRDGRLRALRGCYEVLKMNGLFVMFENVAPRTPEGVRFGLEGWKAFLLAHGWTEERAAKHMARYDTEYFPLTVEQHLELLAKVGFKVVELFWYSQMQAGFYAVRGLEIPSGEGERPREP